MTFKNFLVVGGLIILLIFLAGCTSNASSNTANAGKAVVGYSPTIAPHTIIGTWELNYNGKSGTVKFLESKYVNVDIKGYPGISTQYKDLGNNTYSVSYFTYRAQFQYNSGDDTITSDQYQGVVLKRLA